MTNSDWLAQAECAKPENRGLNWFPKAGLLNRAASYGNNVEKIAEMASDIWLSETTS